MSASPPDHDMSDKPGIKPVMSILPSIPLPTGVLYVIMKLPSSSPRLTPVVVILRSCQMTECTTV